MALITNHFERAVALLASQFRFELANGELTNLQKIIKILAEQAQDIDYVNFELETQRWLDIAIGVQLDLLGEILGLPRNIGESDDDYRERLQFQIFINSSNATPEDIIRALAFLTRSDHIGYFEIPSAFFQLETDGTFFPNPANDLNEAIKLLSPAGVNYAPITATYGVPIPFELGGDLDTVAFFVEPTPGDFNSLEVQPYNSILEVSIGTVEDTGPNGGLDELGFPLATAGQVSELIQKGGNFSPRRF